MKKLISTFATIILLSFFCNNNFGQCSSCTITDPAALPNPIGPGVVVCITTDQTYGGGANLTGGSINVCGGAVLTIHGAVDIDSTSSITVTGCSELDVHGNIDNNNPAGLVVLDGCNCSTAIRATGPILGNPVVCGPLPVELISFDAFTSGNNVTLNWSTATETNNNYFMIERSEDAISWDLVKTLQGAGNSNVVKDYSMSELVHSTGTYYYRLTQVDYDGKSTTYDPIAVKIDDLEQTVSIKIYPNPAADVLMLDVPAGYNSDFTLEIVALSGQVKMSKNIPSSESGTQRLDISGMDNGIFIVRISNQNFIQSSKLIVRR